MDVLCRTTRALLDTALPVVGERVELRRVAGSVVIGRDGIHVTLELQCGFDPPHSITRADVVIVPEWAADDGERAASYVRGWVSAVARIVGSPAFDAGVGVRALVDPEVLRDETASTPEDFAAALLSPFRLGILALAEASPVADVPHAIEQLLCRAFPMIEDDEELALRPFADGGLTRVTSEGLRVRFHLRLARAVLATEGVHTYERCEDVLLVPAAMLTKPARVADYLFAWIGRLSWVFVHWDWRTPEISPSALVFPGLASWDDPTRTLEFRFLDEMKGFETHEHTVLRGGRSP